MAVGTYPTAVNVVTGTLTYPAGSGGSTLKYGKVTTGDVTVSAQASWAIVPGASWTVPAAAGQLVTVETNAMILWASLGSDYFTIAVFDGVSTVLLRSDSDTASATGSNEGDPSLYPIGASAIRTWNCPWIVPVTADLLVNGSLNFTLLSRGAGGAKLFASTSYPLRWVAEVRDS